MVFCENSYCQRVKNVVKYIDLTSVIKIGLTKSETLTDCECFGSSLISSNRSSSISECFLDTTNSRVAMTLPRMAFDITGLNYDAERKLGMRFVI